MCFLAHLDELFLTILCQQDQLAYTKLGTVCLASVGQGADGTVWEVQEVELPLVSQNQWTGSTPWAVCSGERPR